MDNLGLDTPILASELSNLISKMISLAPYAEDFEVPGNLNAPDPGKRLFANAYLLTRPDARFLKPLVEALTHHEFSEFNQYWAILAVEKLVALDGQDMIDPEIVRELVNFLEKLPPGTDRYYELSVLFNPYPPSYPPGKTKQGPLLMEALP